MTLTLLELKKTAAWLAENIERLKALPRPDLIDEQIAGLEHVLTEQRARIAALETTTEQPHQPERHP